MFKETKQAFSHKSNKQLRNELWLMKILFNRVLLKIGSRLILGLNKYGIPIDFLLKPTVFKKFCVGTSIQEALNQAERLSKSGIYSFIHYAAEAQKTENGLDFNLAKLKESILASTDNKHLPFIVFKPTSLGAFNLFEKVQSNEVLNENEKNRWRRIENRFYQVFELASKTKVGVLVDAEESWIQRSIDNLCLDLIREFNKKNPIAYLTVQMYLKNGLDKLESLKRFAQQNKLHIGVKLVRGAYLEKERKRATAHKYASPICETKNLTDENFHSGICYVLNNLDFFSLYLATHSELSTSYTIDLIKKMGIKKNNPRIWFSQLYGMSDHITYGLANQGYQTVKYLPYGPVKEVVPYLVRRSQENTSILDETSREIRLLQEELIRRKLESRSG